MAITARAARVQVSRLSPAALNRYNRAVSSSRSARLSGPARHAKGMSAASSGG